MSDRTKATNESVAVTNKRTPEWWCGYAAQKSGKPDTVCPHKSGSVTRGGLCDRRVRWMAGYYYAKVERLL